MHKSFIGEYGLKQFSLLQLGLYRSNNILEECCQESKAYLLELTLSTYMAAYDSSEHNANRYVWLQEARLLKPRRAQHILLLNGQKTELPLRRNSARV